MCRMVGIINWVLILRVLFCADEGSIVQGNYAKLRVEVCGSKRLGCHVGRPEVSRCHTRDESEESIACQQVSTLALKPRAHVAKSPKQEY